MVSIGVTGSHHRVELFVETRQQLTPQTALELISRREAVSPGGRLVLCSPHISPKVAELCREEEVGYLDGAGNCRLAGPGFFLQISGRPNRAFTARSASDPFSRKSSRIVRALLANPGRGWQVQELAKVAQVSIGLVSKVKNALLEDAHVEERDRRLYVREAGKLLREWADRYRPHVEVVQLFTVTKGAQTEDKIAQWCRDHGVTYALTQLAGAWRFAPMVRHDRSVVYLDAQIERRGLLGDLLHHLDARRVESGANCCLWLTDDPAVFVGSTELNGCAVVSPIQLYLDLKMLPGRGEEAAQAVLGTLEGELGRLLAGK